MTLAALASDCLIWSAAGATAMALAGTICNLYTAPRLEGGRGAV
jgi:hypothetical protein